VDNQTAILGVALDLFSARGYDAVGVQEIVDGAGITKPTLYHYFGSKRGLLQALVDQQYGWLKAEIEPAAAYDRNLPMTLQRVARAYFDFARAHPAFYRMALGAWFAPPDCDAFAVVAKMNADQQAILERLFVAAVPDHGNMRGRERAYAASFLGMVNTYVAIALAGQTELDDALVRQAVHQFQHGIYS
jgi:AcrR family transcriptional regulator